MSTALAQRLMPTLSSRVHRRGRIGLGSADEPLFVQDVTKRFGGVTAVSEVSLRIPPASVTGLIGPNGSGKTTLLNLISGVLAPDAGSASLGALMLSGLPMHDVARAGVVRTFQNIRLFGHLTVLDNVELAAVAGAGCSRGDARRRAAMLLEELRIESRRAAYAGTLAYGDQRRVEIARALAADPAFLLLDEPAAGMNEVESDALGRLITQVCATRNCGVLIVEHDLDLIMRYCGYVYVLNEGRLISHGPPRAIRMDKEVIRAYIGDVVDETPNDQENQP